VTPKVAIIGYASLDHVAMLDSVPTPGRTSTIVARSEEVWPRLGGSPAFVAAALVKAGLTGAYPVSWVGSDPAGERYVGQLRVGRIPVQGLAVVPSARTPIAILAYDPDGGCSCLYDPGISAGLELTDSQHTLVEEADWLCVTIGPAGATRAALDALNAEAKLVWVVKDDPRAMPDDLAARMAVRSDVICHSRAERGFVERAVRAASGTPGGQIVVETQGGSGALIRRNGISVDVPTSALTCLDPTGAGDTFAGGVIAALAGGETDLRAIVEAGHRAAGALLRQRMKTSESA
jgi:ribokinase